MVQEGATRSRRSRRNTDCGEGASPRPARGPGHENRVEQVPFELAHRAAEERVFGRFEGSQLVRATMHGPGERPPAPPCDVYLQNIYALRDTTHYSGFPRP